MKIFRKLLSLFLAFLFVLQLLPIKYIGNFAVKAFALENTESITGYEFDIPKESDNTVDVDIPDTVIMPEGFSYDTPEINETDIESEDGFENPEDTSSVSSDAEEERQEVYVPYCSIGFSNTFEELACFC